MTDCQKAPLRRDIRTYWRKSEDPHRYSNYIRDILPREMACAQAEAGRLPKHKCEQLVFLVGHSLEPLFQSVWAYQPQRVLLILSKFYGVDGTGQGRGQEIKRLLEKELPPVAGIIPPKVVPEVIEDTSTQAVFRKLQEFIRQDTQPQPDGTRPVIIDITGAKKSMVAGAFLFAAYAGVPVSYVDFDDDAYDINVSRPYGDACRIGEIANPYQDFALRDWERVRTLYARYNFQGARQILVDKILPAMGVFFPDHVEKVNRLKDILTCYELWDNGDFSEAKEKADKIADFSAPTAVKILGCDGYWPHGENPQELLNRLAQIEFGDKEVTESIYLSPQRLLTYAYDEINRAKRLIKYHEDYRSALLKAVSLWEVLARARVVGLWHRGKLEVAIDSKGEYQTIDNFSEEILAWKEEIYYGIICSATGGYNEAALKYDPLGNGKTRAKKLKIICRRDKNGAPLKNCESTEDGKTFYVRRAASAPLLNDDVSMGRLETLRHKAIHTYLSVSQKIAQSTYEIVKANLEDYKNVWLPAIWPDFTPTVIGVEAMPWSELWQLCDLSFLPANLKGNENEKEMTRCPNTF